MNFHAVLCAVASLAVVLAAAGSLPAQGEQRKVLFYTQSAGFKHDVVDRKGGELSHAEQWLTKAARGRFPVVCSQDPADLDFRKLRDYRGIVFYTTGELPLSDPSWREAGADARNALVNFVRHGGGFTGIHCATDTFYEFAPYGEMIGGYFNGHPWNEKVGVRVEDRVHPSSSPFGDRFVIKDEIYQFKNWSRERVKVLLSLDPASVDIAKGAREDLDYALAWCREFEKGRVFYTALGHHPEVWTDPRFLVHLVNGIEWTLPPPPPELCGTPQLAYEQAARKLFDGGSLAAWRQQDGADAKWKLADGAMEVAAGAGNLVTREPHGDCELQLEFATPVMPDAKGQARGNSGLYLQGRYEIQVLDSFGVTPTVQDCGAIYGKKAPDLPACLEPGVWQHYRIFFKAARFGPDGKKTANARLTVRQNGLLIHDDVEIDGPTGAGAPEGPEPGPLLLQDHGNPVRYRNIRIWKAE